MGGQKKNTMLIIIVVLVAGGMGMALIAAPFLAPLPAVGISTVVRIVDRGLCFFLGFLLIAVGVYAPFGDIQYL